MGAGKAEGRRGQASSLLAADRQPLTALGTAGINHIASAGGFHSSPKTMGSGALYFAWLVSSFHLVLP